MGGHLRAWRRLAWIEPIEMAIYLGMSKKAYYMLEAGEFTNYAFTRQHRDKFCKTVGIKVSFFNETWNGCMKSD